jgi:hypothetical protein
MGVFARALGGNPPLIVGPSDRGQTTISFMHRALCPPLFKKTRKRPPPLWFVTNGELTVGPVRSDLLLRGVLHGRIPDDCLVRELRWRSWRRLEQIREIRCLRHEQARGSTDAVSTARRPFIDASPWLADASDTAEVLLFALHAAVQLTGAAGGVCHRARDDSGRATVSYANGVSGHDLLGLKMSGKDPSIALAFAGQGTIGAPDEGPVEMAIFDRLGAAALGGVAMFPIVFDGALVAVFELGRSDHPFRVRDRDVLEAIRAATVARLIA